MCFFKHYFLTIVECILGSLNAFSKGLRDIFHILFYKSYTRLVHKSFWIFKIPHQNRIKKIKLTLVIFITIRVIFFFYCSPRSFIIIIIIIIIMNTS
jgi:hypothetical protein